MVGAALSLALLCRGGLPLYADERPVPTIAQAPAQQQAAPAEDDESPASAAQQFVPPHITLTPVVVTPELAARLAVERSYDIDAAVASVEEARAKIREARSLRGIYSSLSLSYTRQGPEPPAFEVMGERISFFNTHVRTQTIGFSKTLYTWGQHELTEHVARLGAEIAADQTDIIRLAAAQMALEKAYTVLLADQLVIVALQNVTALTEHLRVAEEVYDEGLIAFVQVLQAEAEVALAEQSVAAGERMLEVERAELRRLLKLSQGTPLVVEPGERLPVASLELEACIAYALEHRPDLQAAQRGVELVRQSVELARRTSRPTLNANVGARRQNSTALSEDLTYAATLEVQIPILDGGLRRAKVGAARAQLDRSLAEEADLEHDIAFEVRRSLEFIHEADIKGEKALVSERAAREALRISRLRYRHGEATGQEVIDATALLVRSRAAEAQALFERAIALSKLRLAMGAPLDDLMDMPGAQVTGNVTSTQQEEGP